VPRYILFFRGKREGDFKGGEGDERRKEEQKTGEKEQHGKISNIAETSL
jgi:hypothetical protein